MLAELIRREPSQLVLQHCRAFVQINATEDLGALVEEQLNRLTEENLSEVIEARVGEDLNWIRLNGALVGGIVGMLLFVLFTLFEFLARQSAP